MHFPLSFIHFIDLFPILYPLFHHAFNSLTIFNIVQVDSLIYLSSLFIPESATRLTDLDLLLRAKRNARCSSYYLNLSKKRHSDHHENAMKPYQTLLTINESPQLTHGYIVMTVMALIPSIFQRIMNPLVDSYRQEIEKSERTESKQIFNDAVQETRVFIM